jgi:HK97 gp10 family phage protein
MARNRIVLKSNFKLAAREAHKGLEDAVEKWMDVGENDVKNTLTKREAQRGYSLNTLYDSISSEKRGDLDAAIQVAAWYAHFFEYGTVFIDPMPFLRPAKRKADKAFREEAKDKIQQRVKRAAIR